MSIPDLKFSLKEYETRLAKTRAAMEAKGIDLLIVSDPSNMGWLTGYDGWSFYVHQAVIIPPAGQPVWFGRGQDANGAKLTSYLSHDNIIGYPDHYVQSTERHPMDYLSAKLGERGLDKLSIGVEMDNYWFSAAAFASLQKHLPNARFSDATGLVNWQRAIKSETEIAYMRNAARIVEAETAQFDGWLRAQGAVPTIKELRERCAQIARAEAEKTIAQLGGAEALSDKQEKAIRYMAEAIVNKLLHKPLMALKNPEDADALIAATRKLFELADDLPARKVEKK